jgi:flagellar hook-length control protein FliK
LVTQQPLEVAQAAANTVGLIPNPAANGVLPQSDPTFPAGASVIAVPSTLQAAAKAAAIGASAATAAPTLHDGVSSHTASPAASAADASPGSKPEGKNTSNSSSGNDASGKPDHGSNSPVAPQATPAFTQSVNAPSANSQAGVVPLVDGTIAGTATHAPAGPHSAARDAGSSAGTEAALRQSLTTAGADGTISVVSAGRLRDHSGGTEVRIEMQSDSLGSVELRAHVAGNQIGASIAVEHHDAEVMLNTELPALHSALAEKDIRVDTLVVSQGAHTSMGGGAGEDPGQKYFTPYQEKSVPAGQGDSSFVFFEAPTEWTGSRDANARLSVLA